MKPSAIRAHLPGVFQSLIAAAISGAALPAVKLGWHYMFQRDLADWAQGAAANFASAILLFPALWLITRPFSEHVSTHGRISSSRDARPSSDSKAREAVIGLIRTRWVRPILQQPLYRLAKLSLEREEAPGAVGRPMDLTVQPAAGAARRIDPSTSMESLLRDMRAFLILGSAGAGKTTLLVELARELADEAERIPDAPIPVLLSLARWNEKRGAIGDWVIRELAGAVRPEIVGDWIAPDNPANDVVLLLDGLDEVAPEYRAECAAAINRFRAEAPSIPTVVTCRADDYESLPEKLRLYSAVFVCPLSRETVDAAVLQGGESLRALRLALESNPLLYEILGAPLMLDIARLAFEDRSTLDLDGARAKYQLTRQLIAKYVERMLDPKMTPGRAKSRRMLEGLRWMASNLEQNGQLSFFPLTLTSLQWLPSPLARKRVATEVGLLVGAVAGLLFGAIAGALALRVGAHFHPRAGLLAALAGSLLGGLLGGGCGGPLCAASLLLMNWLGRTSPVFALAAQDSGVTNVPLFERLKKRTSQALAWLTAVTLGVGFVLATPAFPPGDVLGSAMGAALGGALIWRFCSWLRRLADRAGETLVPDRKKLAKSMSSSMEELRDRSFARSCWSFVSAVTLGALARIFLGLVRISADVFARQELWMAAVAPFNLKRLLRAATARALLRRSDGAYSFVHPLMMQYFVDYPAVLEDLIAKANEFIAAGAYREADRLFERAYVVRDQGERLNPAAWTITRHELTERLHHLAATPAAWKALAEARAERGKYAEGEQLLRAALAKLEATVGETHVDVGRTLRQLAFFCRKQSKYGEGEAFCRRALLILERALGDDHIEVGNAAHELSVCLSRQGAYDAARPFNDRALTICQSRRGADDPNTAVVLCCKAELLGAEGKFTEARALYKKAIAVRQREMEAGDAALASFFRSFANMCVAEERYDEAERLCQRALAIQEDSLAPGHPDFEETRKILAIARQRKPATSNSAAGNTTS